MLSLCTKLHTDSLMNKSEESLRIGLISPYLGTNLGDTAIIESARTHLIRLFPKAEILLIVLDCERVSRLHGLEAFPLTAVPLHDYFSPIHDSVANLSNQVLLHTTDVTSLHLRLRSGLKKIAGRIPLVLPAARHLRNGLCAIPLEARHMLKVRQVVRSLDGLIIAGGGQFDDEYGGPWGHPYAMYKWVRLASRARVPVYFIGVGVCEINYSLTRFFLRGALARANRVSLRDIGSLQILRRLGIQRELILCPDLAFGLTLKHDGEQFGQVPSIIRPTIGLSPIVFSCPGTWPTAKPAIFDRYWREFTDLAVSLLEAGYSLKLFVTDGGDYYLAKMLYDKLVGAGTNEEHVQLLPLLKLQELITLLRTCDAVIASRLHGVLLSHVSGVPVLGISYHRKVQAHMEDIGQERFNLNFETFTASEARQFLHRLLEERSAVITDVHLACAERYKGVESEFIPISTALAS